METTIIAISNQKGGVGKSTTAYNLGACGLRSAGKPLRVPEIRAERQPDYDTAYHVIPRRNALER